MTPLTKRQFRKVLGVSLDAEVASFFKISPSAVSQWGEDEPIPELRQLKAEKARPDLFTHERVAGVLSADDDFCNSPAEPQHEAA